MLKKAMSLSLAVLTLAPTAALAQSAGDNQYADPLAGQDNQSQQTQKPSTPSTPSGNSGAGTSPSTTGSSNPGDAQASASSPTQARSADTAQPGKSESSTLPRTGSDLPVLLSGLGWMLLLTGIVARRTALDATAALWRRTRR